MRSILVVWIKTQGLLVCLDSLIQLVFTKCVDCLFEVLFLGHSVNCSGICWRRLTLQTPSKLKLMLPPRVQPLRNERGLKPATTAKTRSFVPQSLDRT